MKAAVNYTIGVPAIDMGHPESGMTFKLIPPRNLLIDLVEQYATYLAHNGDSEERSRLRTLAADLQGL